MANVTEYLAPIKIVYTTDYSGDLLHPLIINSVDELIEITPVAFDGEPTTANLNALPDNCKIKAKETGMYVLCIATNVYGTCAAEVGVSLFPCYISEYRFLGFKYSDANGRIATLFAGQYDYLCVYKQTDNRGLRMSRFGTYSIRPENSFGSEASYSVANVQPGDYVAFKVPQESGTTVIYNAEEIARLEKGQTATLSCSGKKMTSDVVVSFGSAGSITYNELITEVEAGKTATLQCAGKKMTGDVYVAVEEGVLLLSGKYEFVDTPDFSGISSGTNIAVNAKYAGTFTYDDIIEIKFSASSSVTNQIIIKRSTGNTNFIYIGNSKGWQGSNVIDFLAEPQEVPLLFYDWVMNNATKVE